MSVTHAVSIANATCKRLGHALHMRRFGGAECGRPGCDLFLAHGFCVVDGKPEVHSYDTSGNCLAEAVSR